MTRRDGPPLAVTMGEPAGIGGEILLKAWAALRHSSSLPFFAIADIGHLRRVAGKAGLDVKLIEIAAPAEAARHFKTALPVLNEPLPEISAPGMPDPANGHAVIKSIERAVTLALEGAAGGVVTCPIHKASLIATGFPYPGHTEFLAALCSTEHEPIEPVMMLASPELRVVPITIHCGLKDVFAALTTERILRQARIVTRALRQDFGIEKPRLAVAGLNPHAGESGAFGREEIEIITPAIETLRVEDIDVAGPLAADSMFHAKARARYDAALCMYHDQALIPLKTIDFDKGVNVTLGLPIIRTSPDHGTAFDIAGNGTARPDSMISAIRWALRLTQGKIRSKKAKPF